MKVKECRYCSVSCRYWVKELDLECGGCCVGSVGGNSTARLQAGGTGMHHLPSNAAGDCEDRPFRTVSECDACK